MTELSLVEEPEGIDIDEVVAQLHAEEAAALMYYNTDLSDRQTVALEYYDAQPMGDEEDGRSSYIEPVVAEVVDDMTIAVLEAFTSGDNVVEFEAGDVDDPESGEQYAAEATATVNYYFNKRMDGDRVLTDWLQSGFNEVIGIVKVAREEEEKVKRKTVVVPVEQLAQIDEESVTNATDNDDGTFTLQISERVTRTAYCVYPIPSEEFLMSPRMRSIDDKVYKAHITYPSKSDLIEMGFDRESVDDIEDNTVGNELNDARAVSRWRDESYYQRQEGERKGANKRVRLLEEYDYFDFDDDGVAELYQIFRVDKRILTRDGEPAITLWEEQPFVDFCPYPRAHKMIGDGLAEKVIPDQRLESVITRQLLDGLYASNAPRRWLPEESIGDNTIDDLLTVRPNGIVRGKGINPPANLSENFDLQKGQSMLSDLRERRQGRTGILNLGKGMDRDALNDTAKGQDQLMTAGEKKQAYVARNFARSVAKMFTKMKRLIVEDGQKLKLKIDGDYREVDPALWPDEMDFSLKVGLGSNRKDKRIAYRMQVAGLQAEAFQAGTGLVTPKELYASATGIIRDMALGEPGDFFAKPTEPQLDENGQPVPEPEQPDPEMEKVKAQMEIEQMKLQQQQYIQEAKLEGDQMLGQQKLNYLAQETAEKLRIVEAEAAEKARLQNAQFEFEANQANVRMAHEMAISERQQEMAERQGIEKMAQDARISKNREGGAANK